MALAVWPAALPQIPLVSQGSTTPYQPPLETEMEDGPPRARRTATSSWTGISLSYLMSAAQFAVYEAFLRDTLQHGSARFTMPVWRPGARRPLPMKTVRITGGAPSWRPAGAQVLVTLPLSVLDY